MEQLMHNAREELFREAYQAAHKSAVSWLREDGASAEAHFICAYTAGKISGKKFVRKEEFLTHTKACMTGRGEAEEKKKYLSRLLGHLDERFAPYARVRPGFVFSAQQEAVEYFEVLEEELTLLDAIDRELPQDLQEIRPEILTRIGEYCHRAKDAYYFEDIDVDAVVPTRRKTRVRYGLMRSLRAQALYRRADEAFRALNLGSAEEAALASAQDRAEQEVKALQNRLEQVKNSSDKLEQLRLQTDLQDAQERLVSAQETLREYRKNNRNPHL